MADVIVYVNPAMVDDTGDGLSAITAKKRVNSGMAICRANVPVSGHELRLGIGDYISSSDYILIDSANLNNLDITIPAQSLVSPDGAACFNCTVASVSVSINGGTLSGAVARNIVSMDVNSTLTFDGTTLSAPDGHTNRSLASVSAGVLNLLNCDLLSVYNDADPRYSFTFSGSASGTIKNCIVRPSKYSPVASTAYLNTSGTVDIDNTLILGAASHGLSCAGTGVYTLRNSVVTGGHKSSAAYPIYRTGGTLSVGNALVVGNPFDSTKTISGTYTDLGGNDLTSKNPKFKSNGRRGYILPCVDDSGNFAHAIEIETLLAAKGFTGTFFLEGVTWNSANTPALREMIGRGVMEVGAHTYTHSSLRASGKLWDVTKDAETVTIDRAADTIALSGGGTVSGFKSKTLAAIKTELETLGATVTPTTLYSTTFSVGDKVYSLAKGEVLDAVVAGTAVNILVDATAEGGLYRAELRDAKALLRAEIGVVTDPQTGVPYECNSIGAPYNATNADSRLAGIASGFLSMRGMFTTDTSATLGKYNHAADLYRIYVLSVWTGIKGDGSEAVIRRNSRALAFAVAEAGLCVSLLTHTTSDLTLQQWGWMLEEFAAFGAQINVCSQQKFALDVRSQGWAAASGVYSKPLTVGDGDHRLSPGSPCIRSGVDVGLTTDADGVTIPTGAGFDIGPYFYNPEVDEGFSPWVKQGTLPALTLSPDCPGSLLEVQEWKKVASAKEIERY